jgi:hypothetical protein
VHAARVQLAAPSHAGSTPLPSTARCFNLPAAPARSATKSADHRRVDLGCRGGLPRSIRRPSARGDFHPRLPSALRLRVTQAPLRSRQPLAALTSLRPRRDLLPSLDRGPLCPRITGGSISAAGEACLDRSGVLPRVATAGSTPLPSTARCFNLPAAPARSATKSRTRCHPTQLPPRRPRPWTLMSADHRRVDLGCRGGLPRSIRRPSGLAPRESPGLARCATLTCSAGHLVRCV